MYWADPPPHTSDRVAACRATQLAAQAAGAEARGHWSAASLPPHPREARARLPRGRRCTGHHEAAHRWAASWWPRLPALAVCAGGRPSGAFAALIGWIGWMVTVA